MQQFVFTENNSEFLKRCHRLADDGVAGTQERAAAPIDDCVNREPGRQPPAALQECAGKFAERQVIVNHAPKALVGAEITKLGADGLPILDAVNFLIDVEQPEIEVFQNGPKIEAGTVKRP